jgi:hypothetical protein
VKKILLLIGLVAFTVAPSALAQSTDYSTKATDLMGERPANSYYQDSGGVISTGTGMSVGSSNASYLKQESDAGLKVDAPTATNQAVLVKTTSTNKTYTWLVFAILAVLFLVIDVVLYIFRGQRKWNQNGIRPEVLLTGEQIGTESVTNTLAGSKSEKPKRKKNTAKHHPVKRKKKR